MKISPRLFLPLFLTVLCGRAGAAVLPPEKLLPKDTLLVITAPDWGKATQFLGNLPVAKMWADPSMKAFKDKFMEKYTAGVTKPWEQSLGIKFSDYASLAQGQVTFAVIPITPKDKSEASVAAVFMMDTKDKAGQLKTDLGEITKKWTDAGKALKSQKIRETDFTTLFIPEDDLSWSKLFPPANKPATPADSTPASTNKVQLTLGQSDSLLVVSTSPEAIDKILSRQAGGMVPPLEESPTFAADYGPRLRESPFYFWLSTKSMTDLLSKLAAENGADAAGPVSVDALLAASGLSSLNSVSFSYKHLPEGDCSQLFVSVPEEKRPALLKMFVAEAKDSSAPSFIPADATMYFRYRLNMEHSWKAFEGLLNELVPPQLMAQLTMVFGMAGKDKDEKYDLKAELLNNLGDDIISYQKPPKSATLADVKSAPAIYLIGSPHADNLAAAFKVLLGMLMQGTPITDREFLGRKIFTAGAPAAAAGVLPSVSFAASGGYVALSTDASILEEYLRSSDSKGKALSETPGLADAAQKVGGMSTGLFGFENDNQTLRPTFEMLRKQKFTFAELLGVPIPDAALANQFESVRQWADFSLLPPFEAISKYFYFSVYAGSSTPDGFSLKSFTPTPPQMRP